MYDAESKFSLLGLQKQFCQGSRYDPASKSIGLYMQRDALRVENARWADLCGATDEIPFSLQKKLLALMDETLII
jgi:hypothetical protein